MVQIGGEGMIRMLAFRKEHSTPIPQIGVLSHENGSSWYLNISEKDGSDAALVTVCFKDYEEIMRFRAQLDASIGYALDEITEERCLWEASYLGAAPVGV